jgi:alpha-D-ribose 1-methylphosphonate 5-triphosphate diphosphatase
MARVIVSGGSVVLPERVVEDGSVVIEDGTIIAIEPRAYANGPARDEWVVDAHDRLVLPGLIDLHNDAFEVEINPRPGANLPLPLALASLDRRLAAAGVTTEFDAVFFADMTRNERKLTEAPGRVRTLQQHVASGRSLVEHHALIRIDVWSPQSAELALEVCAGASVPVVSLNDHTPGQGQYRDVEQFKRYFREQLGRSAEEVERDVAFHMERAHVQSEIAAGVLARVRQVSRERDLLVSSHDDDTPERVELMYEVGARIAEFPVTLEAAFRQRELGMAITAGAPNLVRGGSASGNIGAAELLEHGLVDVLCADYHAPSLLAAMLVPARTGLMSLPEAVRLVTLNPARAVRLDATIGSIEPGKRGDVCVVDASGPVPLAELTLRAGAISSFTPTRRGADALPNATDGSVAVRLG